MLKLLAGSKKKTLIALTLGGLYVSVSAAGATTLISQAFISSTKLPTGSIVSLQKGATDRVDAATTQNADYLLGVVIDDSNSQISIVSSQDNQVNIATSGTQQVLVSEINGDISIGDPITASPIKGVGMRATSNVRIIGVAQDTFPNKTASRQSYTDESGDKQTVQIGQIPVLINVAYFYQQPEKTIIPQAIQNVANAMAGRKVDTLPILVSIAIFVIAMVIVVSIIYSMIRSSIISVGRNPMSQSAVYRNVIQLSTLVILILGMSVGSIYMVLTRL